MSPPPGSEASPEHVTDPRESGLVSWSVTEEPEQVLWPWSHSSDRSTAGDGDAAAQERGSTAGVATAGPWEGPGLASPLAGVRPGPGGAWAASQLCLRFQFPSLHKPPQGRGKQPASSADLGSLASIVRRSLILAP